MKTDIRELRSTTRQLKTWRRAASPLRKWLQKTHVRQGRTDRELENFDSDLIAVRMLADAIPKK